jgi:hypothetical protein
MALSHQCEECQDQDALVARLQQEMPLFLASLDPADLEVRVTGESIVAFCDRNISIKPVKKLAMSMLREIAPHRYEAEECTLSCLEYLYLSVLTILILTSL